MTIKVLNHAATAKTEVPSAKNNIVQPLQVQCQCKELSQVIRREAIRITFIFLGQLQEI